MSWKLIALSEPIIGQAIVIDRDMLIGRHQQADIVLQAAHISRRHATLLLKEDGSLWIQDLGSSNGTFVNDQQVTEQQLKNQDEIHFENIRFQIVEDTTEVVVQNEVPVIPVDEGMPTLEERSADVQLDQNGMPTNIGIPKPAPIPEHIDVTATVDPEPIAIPELKSRVKEAEEQQKNTKVGLISFIVLIMLIILAAILFAGN